AWERKKRLRREASGGAAAEAKILPRWTGPTARRLSTPLLSRRLRKPPAAASSPTSLRPSSRVVGVGGSSLCEENTPHGGYVDGLTSAVVIREGATGGDMEYKVGSNWASRSSGDRYGMKYSSYLNDEPMPDAVSEKEQGNEYFKQKKFAEAIECYSRSIGLSPTAVAFANRAMAYLKLRRQVTCRISLHLMLCIHFLCFCCKFKEAEDDCTEALDLDDRYIKAYSRRITARKELGKLKEAMDDAEFAISLDPNNPELRKQYSEIKTLHMEKMAKKGSVPAKRAVSEIDKKDITSHPPTISQKNTFMEVDSPVRAPMEIRESVEGRSNGGSGSIVNDNIIQSYHGKLQFYLYNRMYLQYRDANHKPGPEVSVQDLASRAASLYMASTVKNIKTPKTAYDFEVSWRALSDDTDQQIQLLKQSIPPASLPEIFKNALSAPFLIDIVKCAATIFRDDAALAVSILENLAQVPRFDLIIMCLSSMHKSELRKIWDQVFLAAEKASADQMEALRRLRGKYIQGGWQDSVLT
ncbi:hypothetical protein U9M48_041762, partial [Paspalum notatum var. saurae]